mgnify:CR=1 FL=1
MYEANPAIYFGLSLGVTFPINILIGIPLYTGPVDGLAVGARSPGEDPGDRALAAGDPCPHVGACLFGCHHLLGHAARAGGGGIDISAVGKGLGEACMDARLLDDPGYRHLLAQIVDRVPVVAQDGVDQVLADVVYITVHGGQHHLPPRMRSALFQELLQVHHRLLHDFGRLQHKRQLHLAFAKTLANHSHRR